MIPENPSYDEAKAWVLMLRWQQFTLEQDRLDESGSVVGKDVIAEGLPYLCWEDSYHTSEMWKAYLYHSSR